MASLVWHATRRAYSGLSPCPSNLLQLAIVSAGNSSLSQCLSFSSVQSGAGEQLLSTLVNWEQKGVPRGAGTSASEDFDLARVRRLLARLGDPHKSWPSIHIAGSKGGSF